jgi:hypothetical protein
VVSTDGRKEERFQVCLEEEQQQQQEVVEEEISFTTT